MFFHGRKEKRWSLSGITPAEEGSGTENVRSSEPEEAPHKLAPAEDDEFAEAQRRVFAHRQAIQALLDNARNVEERLAAEAREARETRERLRIEEKIALVASLVEREQQANALVRDVTQRVERVMVEHAKAKDDAFARSAGAEAAAAELVECQRRLAEARRAMADAEALVNECEERLQRTASSILQAQNEAQEAERKAAECRSAREAGEAEARNAQECAKSLVPSATARELVRSLEAVVRDLVPSNADALAPQGAALITR
jgi:chromosome segregation ATPase